MYSPECDPIKMSILAVGTPLDGMHTFIVSIRQAVAVCNNGTWLPILNWLPLQDGHISVPMHAHCIHASVLPYVLTKIVKLWEASKVIR